MGLNMKLDKKDILPPDFQGWNFENPIFENFVLKIKPKVVIECGTWKGMSAIKLHKALQKLKTSFQLICVDTWLGGIEHMDEMAFQGLIAKKYGYPQLYFQFLSNMHHAKCLKNLLPIPNSTSNAAKWIKNKKITAQLIYIDASHESPDVFYDIKNYWDLLDSGGTMFGDDYSYPKISSDLNRFCKNKKLNFTLINDFWVLNKPILTKGT